MRGKARWGLFSFFEFKFEKDVFLEIGRLRMGCQDEWDECSFRALNEIFYCAKSTLKKANLRKKKKIEGNFSWPFIRSFYSEGPCRTIERASRANWTVQARHGCGASKIFDEAGATGAERTHTQSERRAVDLHQASSSISHISAPNQGADTRVHAPRTLQVAVCSVHP